MKQFNAYVNLLPIDQSDKETLTAPELYQEHAFYLNLISFLTENSDITIPQHSLDNLSFASYLYFRALLAFDHSLDSRDTPGAKRVNLAVFFAFFERSAAELGRLYNDHHPFWKHLASCKQRYFNAIFLEKQWSAQKPTLSEDLFEKIAVGKSAVCDALVYALNGLAPVPFPHSIQWLECLHRLHMAFQYLDDLDDFKKDVAEGQWTYIQSLVAEALKAQGHSPQSISTAAQYRYLFLSGIAENHLRKAIQHLQIAKAIAEKAQLRQLMAFIDTKEERCRNQIKEINLLVQKTKDKTHKSQVLLAADTILPAYTTAQHLQKAIHFLKDSLGHDGYWHDFLTSAGFGRDWITAYVALQLGDIGDHKNLLQEISTKLLSTIETGYNEHIIGDADSMNFLIWLHGQYAMDIPSRYIKRWMSFMHANGGWSTYHQESALREKLQLGDEISLAGWLSPHNCVSAVAACVLLSLKNTAAASKTLDYLYQQQTSDGYISSYWWTSPVYATSFTLMAFSTSGKYQQPAAKMANWLSSQQKPQGYWDNPKANEASALYTALAIKALLLYDSDRYQDSIQRGIHWLLAHQMNDGSWQTNRVLLLPATDVIDPEQVAHWRNSSFGVNVMIDDHNRLFTTATVLNALHQYEQKHALAYVN
ncbi:hypothetical protein GCM10023231_12790 [Olivibacter ginsenosidimutans]|uniref:Squalene cyclase C-terminal domain-containing protein n=1 Tax=Olivibacter ginsenosidimutans TaxID=1176537 RepID=A0ABP9AVM5_9SPHI